MVRGRSRKAEAPTLPSNALVASAVRYPGKIARVYVGAKEWQRECYRHYSICGEARYAASYHGHALSRATLHVKESSKKNAPILDEGPAVDVLDSLFNGSEGQEAMLSAIGQHMTVAGECYLVGREVEVKDEESGQTSTDEVWEILSVTEVKVNGVNWSITSKEEGQPDIPLNDDAVVIRIWRPDPERRLAADSPFKSLLPVLREIEYLTLRIFAEATSRLTGAGIMFVSQDVTFPEPPKEFNGQRLEVNNSAEGLLYTLAEAMISAVENPGSPESIAPVVATVPGEVWQNGGKPAEILNFWTALDENALGMRNNAIQRFALGMDMPPEKMLGISSNSGTGGGTTNGVSHWGAWQIDEDYIKLHIEPLLSLVCTALTIGFLRPLTGGMEVVVGDTTALRLSPDRSKESLELYDRGLIKAEVVIAANGFNPETDAMDEDERKTWLLLMVATGKASGTPEQVAAALNALGVSMPSETTAPERDPKPLPSIESHPVKDMPEAASLLLATCEPLVLTALQRAGNKLKQRGKGGVRANPDVPAYEVHTVIEANGLTEVCMDDAFPHAAMCLNGTGDPAKVVPVLDAYVRTLLSTQRPHARHLLAKALKGVA